MTLIVLYLAAVVAANLTVTWLGPVATIPNAFLLIGLVITTRDRLHEMWGSGATLKLRMAGLIAAGGALSWLLNADAARIALASTIAFAISEGADTLVYQALRERGWYTKVNGSNAVSAVLDSALFPTIAFGVFLPGVVLGQIAAKILGGAVWSRVLRPRPVASACLLLLGLAVPAHAQIVSVGAGSLTTPHGTNDVLEVYAGGPLYALGLRPYTIISWADMDPTEEPTVIVAAERQYLSAFTPAGWGISSAAGPGFVLLPFTDYRPEFQLTNTLILGTPIPRTSVVLLGSWQPFDADDWAVVAKASVAPIFNP